jgi:hypothetical protein
VVVSKNYFAIAPTSFTSNPNPACVGTQITNTYAQGVAGTPPTYCASAAGQLTDEDITRVQYLTIDKHANAVKAIRSDQLVNPPLSS